MASVKFGGGIVKMSGSIGGTTFARNRAGDYARSWKKPLNPNTPYQDIVRATLAFLADRWHSTVTGAQRIAWNQYAGNVVMKNVLGEATYLSGYNHYIRSNSILHRVGAPVVDDGPTVFNLPAQDPVFDVTVDVLNQQLDFVFDDSLDWCSEDNAWLTVFQGVPQGEQVNFFDGPWRILTRFAGNSAVPMVSPQDDTQAVFPVGYNQRVWCYARITRADGRLSEPFRGDGLTGNPP